MQFRTSTGISSRRGNALSSRNIQQHSRYTGDAPSEFPSAVWYIRYRYGYAVPNKWSIYRPYPAGRKQNPQACSRLARLRSPPVPRNSRESRPRFGSDRVPSGFSRLSVHHNPTPPHGRLPSWRSACARAATTPAPRRTSGPEKISPRAILPYRAVSRPLREHPP